MAFNSLLAHVASLITSEANVDDSVPCRSDVLSLRDCVKGATKEVCGMLIVSCVTMGSLGRANYWLLLHLWQAGCDFV
jgi:hypothetical protein